jgi:large subunit ribosomal protein L1
MIMDKKQVEKVVHELRKEEYKKKFSQSFDVIINLKDINLKNPEEQVDFFATLNHGLGKKVKVAIFAGPELEEKAKQVCDLVVSLRDFDKYTDKRVIKKMASEYNFFIAQAEVMPKVAQVFGRVLGPRNKMPNPKLGSVIPAKGQVDQLYNRLQRTVRVTAKKSPVIQIKVGNESMKDEEIIDNIMLVYDQVVHHTPKEKANLRSVFVKLTMSKPIKVE